MKFKTNFFKALFLSALTLSPLVVIASCTSNTSNEEQKPQLQQPTTIKNAIDYQDLGLSSDLNVAKNQIDASFIVLNKARFFNGTTNLLKQAEQISQLKVSLANQNQTLVVSFALTSQSFIEANGLPNISMRNFQTLITGFKTLNPPPSVEQPDQILKELDLIIQQATFDVQNKARLASTINSTEIIWNQKVAHSGVELYINQLLPDDQNGQLGMQGLFYKNNLYRDFTISADNVKAIKGFQKQPAANDMQLIFQEAARLQQQIEQVIPQNEFNINDLNRFKANPQSFSLANLQSGFNYLVKEFNFGATTNFAKQNNKVPIQIALKVQISKNQNHQVVTLTKKAFALANQNPGDDLRPWFPDPEAMRNHEVLRLNKLQTNHLLKQKDFTSAQIAAFQAQPTKFLANIFGLVPQQYFEYQIAPGDFQVHGRGQQASITLQISARLWRDPNNAQKVVKSNPLTFAINITDDLNNWKATTFPTVPDPNFNYSIVPVSANNNIYKPDQNMAVINVDLQQNKDLNIGAIDPDDGEATEALFRAILNQRSDLLFTTSGTLPTDYWNNPNWIIYNGFEFIKDQQSQEPTGFTMEAQFEYINSADPDAWFSATINFTNGYYQAVAKPDPAIKFQAIQTEFQALMDQQALDEIKLHTGAEGVYQFANLRAVQSGLMTGSTWANFLNFSPTEFRRANKFLVDVKVVDDSINYLTNEIKFKWQLIGEKELAGQQWTSEEQRIVYKPSAAWKSQIPSASTLTFANNALRIENVLDRFGFNPYYVSVQNQNEMFNKLATNNWTWKAREFAMVARFLFYQGFNDGASELAVAIENLPTDPLNSNPQNYQVVLKARLNEKGAGTYSPYMQIFGNLSSKPAHQFRVNDVVEIRLAITNVDQTPITFTSAAEILPGLGLGNTWGHGQGDQAVMQDQPMRTDIFGLQLGSYQFSIKVNEQYYWLPEKVNHRFLSLSLLNRYKFSDPFWPDPAANNGWISDWQDLQKLN